MKTLDDIIKFLASATNSNLKDIHNHYCEVAGYPDDRIYDNDKDFFDVFFENNPMGAVTAANYGEYDYSDDFVAFDGYNNLKSGNHINLLIDVLELAKYIFENQEDFTPFKI